MPQIQTLIADIYALVSKKEDPFSAAAIEELGKEVSNRIAAQFQNTQRKGTLRLSGMGLKCPRSLWYSAHHPEMAEQLPPWATIKYTYGHVLEAMVIALAKAAGHEVTGEQDELIVDGVTGHRDCVIDGCLCDVKSSSSKSFEKFKKKTLSTSDSFGYLDQLDGYLVGSSGDPLVRVKDRGYLIAIDKQLGHMCLYEHQVRELSIRKRISEYKQIVALGSPPDCTCPTGENDSAGNIILKFPATYNSFKHCCFPHLRTFVYSDGPRYFTKVVKVPTNKWGPIPEITHA